MIGLAAAAALAPGPIRAAAQCPARVVWLTVAPHPFIEGFRRGMADLGWAERDTLILEIADANGQAERLPELAAALGRRPVDVVVASGSEAVEAARKALTRLPIVDVATHLDQDDKLARPSANITGIALLYDEIAAKWVELVDAVLPQARRIGVLSDRSLSAEGQLATIDRACGALGKTLLSRKIEAVEQIEERRDELRRENTAAVIFVSSPKFTANAVRVVELVSRAQFPAVFESRVLVERGGLMSYRPDLMEVFRRVAAYVDRVLKGAKPADLLIERPSKFELVINLKAATALHLGLPASLLARADVVIE
jgi:putative tryptophan/tyrosine transport system substrate-binding protein